MLHNKREQWKNYFREKNPNLVLWQKIKIMFVQRRGDIYVSGLFISIFQLHPKSNKMDR